MNANEITQLLDLNFDQIRQSKAVRKELARKSLLMFMHIYFADYIKYPSAAFQKEMIALLENDDIEKLVLMAFRGSGKSTIVGMIYPIWAMIANPGRKYVLLAGQTQPQAQQYLKNIKREFETNEILRKDYGPLEESEEWGSASMVLSDFDARITAISVDQSIRGTRHRSARPDLIICDDVEDTGSVKNQDMRDKLYNWLTGEIIPAGDIGTKLVVVGNMLHKDSMLMRLKNSIEKGATEGVFKEYPLLDEKQQPLWSEKFTTPESIAKLRSTVLNSVAWEREYLLNIVANEGQVIHDEWIRYYTEMPDFNYDNEYICSYLSVDLAISEGMRADYTAIVIVHVFGFETKDRRYYVDKRFVNARNTHMTNMDIIKGLYKELDAIPGAQAGPFVLVEDVAYQKAAVQQLEQDGLPVHGVRPVGDKRSRLELASVHFESRRVMIPHTENTNRLVSQLTGFGTEKHDDLCDALTMALNYSSLNLEVDYGYDIASIGRDGSFWTSESSYSIRHNTND